LSIRTTPAGHARSVATVRRATEVINPSFGVARAEGKRMPISTLPSISGRAAVKRPNVTWSRIVCRIRFASGGFQPPSQALAFRRGWFTFRPLRSRSTEPQPSYSCPLPASRLPEVLFLGARAGEHPLETIIAFVTRVLKQRASGPGHRNRRFPGPRKR